MEKRKSRWERLPILAALVGALFVVGLLPGKALASPFSDVADGSWYAGAVTWAKDNKVMNGYEDGRFGPENDLLREQEASVLYNYLGDGATSAATSLRDVVQSQWYAKAVNWSVASGTMLGYSGSDTFGVGNPLTREELAAVMARVCGADLSEVDMGKYDALPDHGSTSGWAVGSVAWAVQNGVINGLLNADGSRMLAPQGRVSRAQMAAVMMNAVKGGLLKDEAFDEFASVVSEMVKDGAEPSMQAWEVDHYYAARLIVKDDGTMPDFSSLRGVIAVASDGSQHSVVQFDSSKSARDAESTLASNPHVVWVEPDGVAESSAGTSSVNAASHEAWGVEAIGADVLASSLEGRGGSVTVAVIDTGVDMNHELLKGRVVPGYDYVDDDDDSSDAHGHGTHVAGIIVDCTPGLDVKVMPVRSLNAGGRSFNSSVVLGIRHATRSKVDVINLSLGGERKNNAGRWNDEWLDEAIDAAIASGITVVVSSGNDNENTANACPAHLSEVIVVGAVGRTNERYSESNFGSSVDVVAPGVRVGSSWPGGRYVYNTGTSMAAPHISAAAAMIKLQHPEYTPAQVEEKIKSCCTDLGSPGRDDYYGYGIPDLSKLVSAKGSVDAYTWAELSAISKRIAATSSEEDAVSLAKSYNLTTSDGKLDGTQTKQFRLDNGLPCSAQIIGFRHDDLAYASGKAGISWLFVDSPAKHVYDDKNDNTGGWEASSLRGYMNKEFYDLLPSDLQAVIRPVKKLTNNVGTSGGTSSVTTTTDTLWALSYREVCGDTRNEVLRLEGEQYKLYRDCGVYNHSEVFPVLKKDGGDYYWWLRSPSVVHKRQAAIVRTDGNPVFDGDCVNVSNVVPAFCI